jgi:hypothetical protein
MAAGRASAKAGSFARGNCPAIGKGVQQRAAFPELEQAGELAALQQQHAGDLAGGQVGVGEAEGEQLVLVISKGF